MRSIRNAMLLTVALLLYAGMRAAEERTVETMLSLETVAHVPPVITGKIVVLPARVFRETQPAIHHVVDGVKVLVEDEKTIEYTVPPVLETVEYKLIVEGELTKNLYDFAGKNAKVEIVGEKTNKGFVVSAIQEVRQLVKLRIDLRQFHIKNRYKGQRKDQDVIFADIVDKPGKIVKESIPAVFRDEEGAKVLVSPEMTITHMVVPTLSYGQSFNYSVAEEIAAEFKELVARSATVEAIAEVKDGYRILQAAEVHEPIKIEVTLNSAMLKDGLPNLTATILVARPFTYETIPAVYKDKDGQKVIAEPEGKREIPIPPQFGSVSYRLTADEKRAQLIRELCAKDAKVQIEGEQTGQGFKVISVKEIEK